MKTFIAGGGLGDCVLLLNKWKRLAGPDDKLVYFMAQKQRKSEAVVREFWQSQGIPHEIRIVPEISSPLNHYDHAACRKLNPLIYGMGFVMVERWKWVLYPFDAFPTPYLQFKLNPSPYERYCVIQSDAGTIKYRGHKNWLNTGWLDHFITAAKARGLRCVLVGSKDIGIKGADHRLFNIPIADLLGILAGADFVLGLQGFVTLAALHMRKRVLLKRENFRVIFNYFHPRWRHHGRIFTEPRAWPISKTGKLLAWGMAT